MDHNLVRSWLGLPPGLWPPDHYTLLGLPAGSADAATVEPRVLDRMDRLRRYQLLHPELVTEGMNRLAQALITLTDPAGKAVYDADLGVTPASPLAAPKPQPPPKRKPAEQPRVDPLVIARPVIDDFLSDEAPLGLPADPDRTQVIDIPSFEVVEGPPPAAGNLVVSESELFDPVVGSVPDLGAARVGVVEAVAVAGRVRTAVEPEARRWIYTRLAVLRRAIRAWDRLRPVVADPDDPLDRPGRVLALLEAAAVVRPELPGLRGVLGEPGYPGGIVAAVISQPLILDTFRRLLPDQRQSVSADWRAGLNVLRGEYSRLRQLARQGRAGLSTSGETPLGRWLLDNPEWVLLLLAAIVLFTALVRGSTGG